LVDEGLDVAYVHALKAPEEEVNQRLILFSLVLHPKVIRQLVKKRFYCLLTEQVLFQQFVYCEGSFKQEMLIFEKEDFLENYWHNLLVESNWV
jgi:hypothetical protein